MSILLSEEEIDQERPVLFFYTNDRHYTEPFFEHYQKNFKLLVISQNKPQLHNPFYFLSSQELDKYQGISDKVEYGIIHLSLQSDKAYVQKLLTIILNKNPIPLVFLIPVRLIGEFSDILLQYTTTPKVSFLLMGDIYSPEFETPNTVSSTLRELALKHSFQLEGNDLEPVFPISLADALSGIASILFSSRKKCGVFYLFYKHPQSISTLIQLARRVEPEIRISYKEPNATIKRFTTHDEIHQFLYAKISKKGQYLEHVFNGFEESIIPFFTNTSTSQNQPIEKGQKNQNKTRGKKIIKKHVKRFVIFWVLFLGGLSFFIVLITSTVFFQAIRVKSDLEKGNFVAVTKRANQIHTILTPLDPSIRLGFKIFSLIPLTDSLKAKYIIFYDAISLGDTLYTSEQIAKKFPEGLKLPELKQLNRDAVFAYFQAQRILSIIGQSKALKNTNSTEYLTIAPLLPDILGYSGKKTYLLLFQNNHELRPTGGFIGTVGTLILADGKIESLEIEDVYELDGQLTKHVEPNYVIRKYLQPHLYLRDSNFDINFQESAEKAAQIYAIETGTEVDGVIAVNYEVLERILAITGPITIETLNLTFSQDTAFETIQNEIHKDFFPGSTQKKDVLSLLFEKIDEKIMSDPNKTSQLLGLFPIMLKEKHILFAFKQNSIQKIMSTLNLASDISDYRLLDRKTLRDFLFLNEANIGSNKVNQYITRDITYELDLSKEVPEGKIIVTIDNQSPKDDYLAYFRLGLPYKSVVKDIQIDGTSQEISQAVTDFQIYENPKYTPPLGIELDNSFQYDKQVYGFIHSIPKGKKQMINIIFDSSLAPRLTSVVKYSLLYQKQPGTQTYPLTFTLKYPSNYTAETQSAFSYGEGAVSFQKNISTDQQIDITLLNKPKQ